MKRQINLAEVSKIRFATWVDLREINFLVTMGKKKVFRTLSYVNRWH